MIGPPSNVPGRSRITLPSLRATSYRHSRLRRGPIQRFLHLRDHAFLPQGFLVFLAQEWVLQPVRNGGAALRDVDCAFVSVLLARNAGLVLAMVVGPVPADQAQRIATDAEMGVKPVAAIWRR